MPKNLTTDSFGTIPHNSPFFTFEWNPSLPDEYAEEAIKRELGKLLVDHMRNAPDPTQELWTYYLHEVRDTVSDPLFSDTHLNRLRVWLVVNSIERMALESRSE